MAPLTELEADGLASSHFTPGEPIEMEPYEVQRPLFYGVYEATPAFRAIEQHSCVCFADMGLVASTGPAEDEESRQYAELFAAAPELLAVVQEFVDLYFCPDTKARREAERALFGRARLALKKARGAQERSAEANQP